MVVLLKVLAIAAVGGVAFIFMRPHVPIMPPVLLHGKKRKVAVDSDVQEHDELPIDEGIPLVFVFIIP